MGLETVERPDVEPITPDEVKAHARILTDAEDALIAKLIPAARRRAESRCNRSFAVQTYELTLDGFPSWRRPLELPRPPLVAVESVAYLATDGTLETLDPSACRVVPGTPGLVAPAAGASWPATLETPGAVKVRYSAGWSAEELPEDARLALLMLVAHWYDRREPIVVGTIVAELPMGVADLLDGVDWRTRG
ncbi:MAG TPA: head-tail connector protein [Acidimicrobiales bacterium]